MKDSLRILLNSHYQIEIQETIQRPAPQDVQLHNK